MVVILVVAFLFLRKRNAKDKESIFGYDNEDYDIREDVMDYDDEGAGNQIEFLSNISMKLKINKIKKSLL